MDNAIENAMISVAYTYGAITSLPIYTGYILGAIQQNLGIDDVEPSQLKMATNAAKHARMDNFDGVAVDLTKLRPIKIFDKEYSHTDITITGSVWFGHTSPYRTS